MIREKMFVISDLLDESIKAQTPIYDVSLFKSFTDFESYIEGTPIIINTVVISTRELPFSNTNMMRLIQALESPFLTVTGSLVYVIDKSYNKSMIEKFFAQNEVKDFVIYQNDIDLKYITDIITGEARDSQEVQSYEVTYRIRAKDYIRQAAQIEHDNIEQDFVTDERELEGIPDEEEPEDILPETTYQTTLTYVSGEDREERTLLIFLIAQYKALAGKTVIVEHDVEYHRLTEYTTKARLDNLLLIEMNELYDNIEVVLDKIRNSKKNLIVIGAVDRVKFDYAFIFGLLYSNLKGHIADMIMECNYDEVPYNVNVIYVCQNTVPDVLKLGMSIQQDIIPEKTKFIGFQMHEFNPIDLNTNELLAILSAVLSKNELDAECVYSGGIKLRGERTAYDICSIISRAN